MYEKLIGKLKRWPRVCVQYDNSVDELLDKAADAIEELSKPRWIPVTERLPEKRKWVLCTCRSNIVDVLRYENAEWYHDPTHIYMFEFVTHWMPLPTPPKEAET